MTRLFALPKSDAELSEAEFSKLLFSSSRSHPGLAVQLGWGLRYHTYRSVKSPTGFPDWVIVRERVIFVETKTQRGLVSAAQEEWIAGLRAALAEAYIWRPGDLSDGEIAAVLQHRGAVPRRCGECLRVFVHRRGCLSAENAA